MVLSFFLTLDACGLISLRHRFRLLSNRPDFKWHFNLNFVCLLLKSECCGCSLQPCNASRAIPPGTGSGKGPLCSGTTIWRKSRLMGSAMSLSHRGDNLTADQAQKTSNHDKMTCKITKTPATESRHRVKKATTITLKHDQSQHPELLDGIRLENHTKQLQALQPPFCQSGLGY